jgi:hypothetical protein
MIAANCTRLVVLCQTVAAIIDSRSRELLFTVWDKSSFERTSARIDKFTGQNLVVEFDRTLPPT